MFKRDIKSMLPVELEEYFSSINERTFRAGQVFKWLHEGIESFNEMTNLPVYFRKTLEENALLYGSNITEKYSEILLESVSSRM